MAELDYDYLAALVKKAQKGDSAAFAELYTATYQKQYRFTYQYVKDFYLAQDVLQNVYILVFKKINTLKNPRLFVPWLKQINFRICFDVYQKQVRHKQELNYDEMHEMSDRNPDEMIPGPEQMMDEIAEKEEMMSCILALPPEESQAIIMKYYHEMSLEEIAGAMNCHKSTVKRRLASGRKKLKSKMSDETWGGGASF